MSKILSEWKIGKYIALELDEIPPMREYNKFRIDGKEYTPIPVYDLPRHIAIEAQGNFKGKFVEFV